MTPAPAAASSRAWHAAGCHRLSDPATPGASSPTGMGSGSASPSTYWFHSGAAVCAPASSSTSSTPSVRASATPHICMLSPRTRSGNSTVLSSTVTPSPSRARAAGAAPPRRSRRPPRPRRRCPVIDILTLLGRRRRRSDIASATASTVRWVLARGTSGNTEASSTQGNSHAEYPAVGADHARGRVGRPNGRSRRCAGCPAALAISHAVDRGVALQLGAPFPVGRRRRGATTPAKAGEASSSRARRRASRRRARSARADNIRSSMTGWASGSGEARTSSPRDAHWLTHTPTRPNAEAGDWFMATSSMSFSPAPSSPDE